MAKDQLPPDRTALPDRAEEVQRLRLHQRILRDFGRIALEELEIGPLLQRAVAQAARATGVRHSKVMRYRVEQGDLLVEAGVGWKPGVVGKARFGTDLDSPSGRALQTGQPVLIDDIRNHPEFRLHPFIAALGVVSLLNVLVTYDSVVWGVLEADSERPGHFGEAEAEFLETLAALLAGALQRHDPRLDGPAEGGRVAVGGHAQHRLHHGERVLGAVVHLAACRS
jgi:two-component system, sensor histidine kinase PdtaS